MSARDFFLKLALPHKLLLSLQYTINTSDCYAFIIMDLVFQTWGLICIWLGSCRSPVHPFPYMSSCQAQSYSIS